MRLNPENWVSGSAFPHPGSECAAQKHAKRWVRHHGCTSTEWKSRKVLLLQKDNDSIVLRKDSCGDSGDELM
jgi:hypothetical protein